MGVKGLWTILGPAGTVVKLPSLAGQKLAIDASIWILQLLNSRHRKGKARAYISGLYLRLGKLLSFGIRPVVVFDGATPALKSQVCSLRLRSKRNTEEKYRQTLLELLAAKLIHSPPSVPSKPRTRSPSVSISSSSQEDLSEEEETKAQFQAASNSRFDAFSEYQVRKYCAGLTVKKQGNALKQTQERRNQGGKEPTLSPRRLEALVRLGIVGGREVCTIRTEEDRSTAGNQPERMVNVESSSEESESSSSESDSEEETVTVLLERDREIPRQNSAQLGSEAKSQEIDCEKPPSATPSHVGPVQSLIPTVNPEKTPKSTENPPKTSENQSENTENQSKNSIITPDFPRLSPVPQSLPQISSLSDHIEALESQIRLYPIPDDLNKAEIREEIKELLGILGIPWVDSPMEAEAQCVELEAQGYVDGVITEDSDVFLFGAKQVYRGLLSQSCTVESYNSLEIQQTLGLTRLQLVCLAQLLGCDYHPGIPGIGPVLGTEAIQAFGDLGTLNKVLNDLQSATKEQSDLLKRRSKSLKKSDFSVLPDTEVEKAFFSPIVDKSIKEFQWFRPEMSRLKSFLTQKLGWSAEKCSEFTRPLELNVSLEVFFQAEYYKKVEKKAHPKSSRLRKALKIE